MHRNKDAAVDFEDLCISHDLSSRYETIIYIKVVYILYIAAVFLLGSVIANYKIGKKM